MKEPADKQSVAEKAEVSWPARQGDVFCDRFEQWLSLRAQLFAAENDDAENPDFDKGHDVLSQSVDDAARLAMTTHAPEAWMVWHKFEILEVALFAGDGDPLWTDRRQMWMIAAIKADLAALAALP